MFSMIIIASINDKNKTQGHMHAQHMQHEGISLDQWWEGQLLKYDAVHCCWVSNGCFSKSETK